MQSSDGRFRYLGLGHDPVPEKTAPEHVHHVGFRCRRADTWCSVNLRGRGHDVPNGSWTWDGNVDQPTLEPSINCMSERCWHGFITGGVYFKQDRVTREEKQ